MCIFEDHSFDIEAIFGSVADVADLTKCRHELSAHSLWLVSLMLHPRAEIRTSETIVRKICIAGTAGRLCGRQRTAYGSWWCFFLSSLGRNKQKQARDEDFRPPHLLDSDKALFRKDLPLGPNAVHLSIHEAHKEAREHFRG